MGLSLIIKYWRGQSIILVWGHSAFTFLKDHDWVLEESHLKGDGYTTLILKREDPTLMETTKRVYGGSPTLLIDCQLQPVDLIEAICNEKKRWITFAFNLPFWLPNVIVIDEESNLLQLNSLKPSLTQVTQRSLEMGTRSPEWICYCCFQNVTIEVEQWVSPQCKHQVCSPCVFADEENFPSCYHPDHKKLRIN